LQEPNAGHRSEKSTCNTKAGQEPRSESSARETILISRPRPRVCIAARAPPQKILASPPEIDGGRGLVAASRTPLVVNPALRHRSIGIAAAQAFAFTTTDPGARLPPWTLQGNTRRCVVDTDGLTQHRDQQCDFQVLARIYSDNRDWRQATPHFDFFALLRSLSRLRGLGFRSLIFTFRGFLGADPFRPGGLPNIVDALARALCSAATRAFCCSSNA